MQKIENPSIINRAGFIPFYIDENNKINMLFMVPTENEWIESVPQICKGRIEQNEMLLRSAIREAKEELGLKQTNLVRIEPVGQYSTIMVYVGEIKDPNDFDCFDTNETKETKWLTLEQYIKEGRALHIPIVEDAVEVIKGIKHNAVE